MVVSNVFLNPACFVFYIQKSTQRRLFETKSKNERETNPRLSVGGSVIFEGLYYPVELGMNKKRCPTKLEFSS